VRIKHISILMIMTVSALSALSLEEVAKTSYANNIEDVRVTAISRLSTNRYAKGVKYNYFYHKEIVHRMNKINPHGILYLGATVNSDGNGTDSNNTSFTTDPVITPSVESNATVTPPTTAESNTSELITQF